MAKREMWELQCMQGSPLSVKIRMTESRIREWVDEFGEDGVYVSFSGGKDSTVLLHIARKLFPNIPAVFVDVPTQYPELREFAKTWDNVEIIRPKTSFVEVCEKYGFPLISKEVSECVSGARKYLTRILEENSTLTNEHHIHTSIEGLQEQGSTVNFQKPLVKQIIEQSQISLGGVRQQVSKTPRNWRVF